MLLNLKNKNIGVMLKIFLIKITHVQRNLYDEKYTEQHGISY